MAINYYLKHDKTPDIPGDPVYAYTHAEELLTKAAKGAEATLVTGGDGNPALLVLRDGEVTLLRLTDAGTLLTISCGRLVGGQMIEERTVPGRPGAEAETWGFTYRNAALEALDGSFTIDARFLGEEDRAHIREHLDALTGFQT
jgi:hypothetical protein